MRASWPATLPTRAIGDGRVSTAQTPAGLAARFDEPLPQTGRPLAEVLARLERDVVAESNRLMHPRSMGHQVSAPMAAAVWAEALTAALNQSGAVWEMSPVGTVVETQVVRWMCGLAGFGPGAGGTFTSGGTEANFAGLLAARQAALPEAWARGVGASPPVVVCGEHAHYGVARAVGELGLGTDHIVSVPSRDFRMDAAALERALDRLAGERRGVMAVVATAGTTATGSFDDLEAIGTLCEARGLWLHVDGAHGASALVLAGPSRPAGRPAPRAIAGVGPAQDDAHAAHGERRPGPGRGRPRGRVLAARTVSLPRRTTASGTGTRACAASRARAGSTRFKVWVAIQRHGAAAFGALYDHLCETAAALFAMLQARPDFATLHEPQANILCFRYVGDRTRDDESLDALNLELRTRYNRGGDGWITTTVLGGRRVLRVTLMNPRTTSADLARVVDGLARLGAELPARR